MPRQWIARYNFRVSQSRRTHLIDPRVGLFGLASLAVFVACRAVMVSAAFARNPDVGYFGVTFDLCITIPLLYYALVVRTRRAAPATLVPLFVVCMLVARMVVPPAHRAFLGDLALLRFPLAIATITLLATRVRRGIAAAANETDVLQRVERICREAFAGDRIARSITTEVAAVYLGLFGWRLPEPAPSGVPSTTFHRRSGWGSIVACILVMFAAEGIGVHLFVQRWSHRGAWILTILDIWGFVWLIGDYHAFRVRPLLVTDDAIQLRFGFRWTATIPRDNVLSVERLAPGADEKLRRTRTYLRLAIFDEPEYLITLREPVRVHGIAGITRTVTSIGIFPDDPAVVDALRYQAV
jgi:hypothetical protein